jgi:hypothetical protein
MEKLNFSERQQGLVHLISVRVVATYRILPISCVLSVTLHAALVVDPLRQNALVVQGQKNTFGSLPEHALKIVLMAATCLIQSHFYALTANLHV